MAWIKEEKPDELGPKRVFSLNHSEIKKGVTQCEEHEWRKVNEIELECIKCPTIIICEKGDKRLT